MLNKPASLVRDVVGLFYPRICGGCDAHLMKHEENLCLNCLHGLPKTYYWDYKVNPVEQLFFGRLRLSSACSFLHFEKGSVTQRLMHRFKYEGKSNVAMELGKVFGNILKEKQWFSDADLIVPVPLHPAKEMRRGYNQSSYIADGLSESLDVPVRSKLMKRVRMTDTQTQKSRFERSQNVDSVFQVDYPSRVRGKNIILVDDVVTTGATLEAAGMQLLEAGVSKLYIATLAVA
ncbi:MAG: ComF family protein [Flavobacteriales bacterium]|nr:ComF family protein [Flavobacteriales bacterium]